MRKKRHKSKYIKGISIFIAAALIFQAFVFSGVPVSGSDAVQSAGIAQSDDGGRDSLIGLASRLIRAVNGVETKSSTESEIPPIINGGGQEDGGSSGGGGSAGGSSEGGDLIVPEPATGVNFLPFDGLGAADLPVNKHMTSLKISVNDVPKIINAGDREAVLDTIKNYDKANTKLELDFSFLIPDPDPAACGIQNGNTYYVAIPGGVFNPFAGGSGKQDITIPGDAEVFAVADFSNVGSGRIGIEFTDHAFTNYFNADSGAVDVGFNVGFRGVFTDSFSNVTPGPSEANFTIGETTTTVKIPFEKDAASVAITKEVKTPETLGKAKSYASWKITAKPTGDVTLKSGTAIIEDTLSTPNAVYKESSVKLTHDGKTLGTEDYTCTITEPVISGTPGSLKITLLKDLPMNGKNLVLEYDTTLNPEYSLKDTNSKSNVTVENSVVFKDGADITTDPVKKSATINYHSPIEKAYKSYDKVNNRILWDIKINPNRNELAAGTAITDTLPEGLEYHSFTVSPTDVKLNANSADPAKVVLTLDEATDKAFTITLTLNNKSPIDHDGNYTNKAELAISGYATFSVEVTGGPGIGGATITKSGKHLNGTKFEWIFKVNRNSQRLTKFKIEDTFPSGSKLTGNITFGGIPINVDKLLELDKASGDKGAFTTYTIEDVPDGKTQKLTLEFNGTLTKEYELKIGSEITNYEEFQNNVPVVNNTANITIGNNTTAIESGGVTMSGKLIDKKLRYNPNTNEFIWYIAVNAEKLPLTNAVITDQITQGWDKLDIIGVDTYKGITDETGISADNIVTGTDWAAVNSEEYEANGTIKISLKNGEDLSPTINDSFLIRIRAKLTPEGMKEVIENNGDQSKSIELANTAKINADNIFSNNVTSTVGPNNFRPVVVGKDGVVDNTNGYIDWTLFINKAHLEIPNAVNKVEDVLPEGSSLNLAEGVKVEKAGEFKIFTNTDLSHNIAPSDNWTPLTEGEDFGYSYDSENRRLVVTIHDITPGEVCRDTYRIKYRTDIDVDIQQSGTKNFTNKASWGVSENPVEANKDTSFNFGSFWGGASATQAGGIKLKKTDGHGNPLEGAVFSLVGKDTSYSQTMTTDDNGEVKFRRLALNKTYTLTEIDAPYGYALNPEPIDILVEKSLKNGYCTPVDDAGNERTLVNYAVTGEIEVTKVDADDESKKLAGAEFTLYKEDGFTPAEITPNTAVTEVNGKAVFSSVPLGRYVIKETKAPDNYMLTAETFDVSVTAKADAESGNVQRPVVTITSEGIVKNESYGAVGFMKVEAGTDIGLGDAVFEIFNSDGVFMGEETSNSNGYVEFSNLPFDQYTIKEKTPPDTYLLNTSEISVTVNDGNNDAVINLGRFENTPARTSVYFTKTDKDTGEGLGGGSFSLADEAGNPISTATSDANGLVTFSELRAGSYTITETKAPDGYFLRTDAITFDVTKEMLENQSNMLIADGDGKYENTIGETSVYFTKVRAGMHSEKLKDVEFSLSDADGDVIATAVSDDNGLVSFDKLKMGSYVLKETKAASGYIMLTGEINFEITHDMLENPSNMLFAADGGVLENRRRGGTPPEEIIPEEPSNESATPQEPSNEELNPQEPVNGEAAPEEPVNQEAAPEDPAAGQTVPPAENPAYESAPPEEPVFVVPEDAEPLPAEPVNPPDRRPDRTVEGTGTRTPEEIYALINEGFVPLGALPPDLTLAEQIDYIVANDIPMVYYELPDNDIPTGALRPKAADGIPKTGDDTAPYAAVALGSLTGMLALAFSIKKDRAEE